MEERQENLEQFQHTLLIVVGQAFSAAGYHLDENPIQRAGGRFRFKKAFENDEIAWIDFQALIYTDTMWSSGAPSRFRISLSRGKKQRTLSALIVEDFGVAVLPSADHWWSFRDVSSLGQSLAEAGRLVIGYGIPWLAGDLVPPDSVG